MNRIGAFTIGIDVQKPLFFLRAAKDLAGCSGCGKRTSSLLAYVNFRPFVFQAQLFESNGDLDTFSTRMVFQDDVRYLDAVGRLGSI